MAAETSFEDLVCPLDDELSLDRLRLVVSSELDMLNVEIERTLAKRKSETQG
jgi:hypothetical protein